jgi:hypothetical protein
MAARTAFGDVELMLVGDGTDPGYLEEFGSCFTSTPPNLKDLLAGGAFVLRVARVGGGESSSKSSDEPRVNVQVYALRSADAPRAAHNQAAAVRAAMFNLPALTKWGRLDSATTESGPTEFPWPDPEIQVVQQIFRLSTRP